MVLSSASPTRSTDYLIYCRFDKNIFFKQLVFKQKTKQIVRTEPVSSSSPSSLRGLPAVGHSS